jgi:hypothetical protein
LNCCSTINGSWDGIFSVPLPQGAATRIIAGGDRLPRIGPVTLVDGEFSVDNGDVAFIARNESVSPTLRGIFLLHQGKILKVFASGDPLDGGVLTQERKSPSLAAVAQKREARFRLGRRHIRRQPGLDPLIPALQGA